MQEVVIAVVVGIVVGLMIVPVIFGIRWLMMKAAESWQLNQAEHQSMTGKKKTLAKQPKKTAVVAADQIPVAPMKRRGRPANSVEKSAVRVTSAEKTIGGTKKVRLGRPSNAEKARRAAEAKKVTDARSKRQVRPASNIKKAAVSVTKAIKSVDGAKKVRLGRPSNSEKARRAAEAAVAVDDRTMSVDKLNQGTADTVNAEVHPELLNLSSEQLFALAVMRESQQSSLLAAGTAGNEPISIG